jgi:C1A family cysteine protease
MPKRMALARILNCRPSPGSEKDWTVRDARQSGLLRTGIGLVPSSRDLRESWWKVADQGRTGSCVGWATADSLLRWYFVKAKRLRTDESLSPRFVWMAAKETDQFTNCATTFIESEGTTLKAALDVARTFGVVADSILPFKTGTLYQGDATTFYATASRLKIAAYFNMGRDLSDWRAWLAEHGPILTRVDVDETWDNAKETEGRLERYQRDTARGGHAVSLVGYTPDMFIVRNSWGTSTWGDHGFGYATNSYARDAFSESYGVVL